MFFEVCMMMANGVDSGWDEGIMSEQRCMIEFRDKAFVARGHL